MNYKSKIYGVLILFFLFPKFATAQDTKSTWIIESKEPVIEKDKVNKIIDSMVEDFFLKEQSDSSDPKSLDIIDNTSSSWLNNSITSNNDRKLEMDLSYKGSGAKIRVLDKIYGNSEDFELSINSNILYDSVNVLLKECFYQDGNPQGDALALVRIIDFHQENLPFNGWISSKQSHLTNYDNYRYSLWLLSCTISDQE